MSHKDLHTNVLSSFIYNSPLLETTIERWMDKQNVAYPNNGTLFSNKKEWTNDTCSNMNES